MHPYVTPPTPENLEIGHLKITPIYTKKPIMTW